MRLSRARLVPVPMGQDSSLAHRAGARQGLIGSGGSEGQWALVTWLVSQRAVGPALCWVPAWTGREDPSGHGSDGAA
jgi:hypothetical protein